MKTWIRYTLIGVMVVLAVLVLGYGSYVYYDNNFSKEDYENYDPNSWINPLLEQGIQDNKSLYNLDKEPKVEEIYITVLENQSSNITLEEMVLANDMTGDLEKQVDIFFETKDDKNLFNNGLYMKKPNATLQIRGKSSQESPVKSFKIKLGEQIGLWNGQNIINLNKNYFDSLRIRSKLSFDYISMLPDINSMQTSFVRLFIRDLSSEEGEDKEFVDYGFYTQVEQPNKMFLKNHNLDPEGQLYMAEDFKFYRYEDNIKTTNEEGYSKSNFEEVLEIKGNKDHTKLINMLNEVNNENNDINDVIENYFERENYLTWMAINILFDNYQTNEDNFLLYSPLNSTKWYFIPWDFDEAWGNLKERPKWRRGISMYWDNSLHKRFLSDQDNIKALSDKIEELSKIINKDNTKKLLDRYYNIVMSNVTKTPDLNYMAVELKDFIEEYNNLPNLTESNKIYYYESVQTPMPFSITSINADDTSINIEWEESMDLQGEEVTYTVEVSEDSSFNNVYYKQENITDTKLTVGRASKERQYIRVSSKDSSGNIQISYSRYDNGDKKLFGVDSIK